MKAIMKLSLLTLLSSGTVGYGWAAIGQFQSKEQKQNAFLESPPAASAQTCKEARRKKRHHERRFKKAQMAHGATKDQANAAWKTEQASLEANETPEQAQFQADCLALKGTGPNGGAGKSGSSGTAQTGIEPSGPVN
jgi:hypothetical protein